MKRINFENFASLSFLSNINIIEIVELLNFLFLKMHFLSILEVPLQITLYISLSLALIVKDHFLDAIVFFTLDGQLKIRF